MNDLQLKKEYTEPSSKNYPYNILSVCIFDMKNPYTSKENKYTIGMKYTLDHFQKYLPRFYLRVYYDHSIVNSSKWTSILKELRSHPRVQLVKYFHPSFIGQDGLHLGTFGTIIRMIPVFVKDPGVECVLIGDIDNNSEMFRYWKPTYYTFIKSKCAVHFLQRWCTSFCERLKHCTTLYNLPFAPLLNSFWINVSKFTFPMKILDEFMTCIKHSHESDNLNKKSCEDVNAFVHDTDHNKTIKKVQIDSGPFLYGIDEICLLRMLSYVIKSRRAYSYHSFPDLLIPFKEIYRINVNLVNTPEHIELIANMMGRYYNNKDNNWRNLYALINQYTIYLYKSSDPNKMKQMVYISNNIKRVYKQIVKEGKAEFYGLDANLLECVYSVKSNSLEYFLIKPSN
jgi:hypothetical protein